MKPADNLDDIAHEFKIKYGCPPGEPTHDQIRQILSAAAQLETANGRQVTEAEIAAIVQRIVPNAGTWKYGSMSYQSMRDLLIAAQAVLAKK